MEVWGNNCRKQIPYEGNDLDLAFAEGYKMLTLAVMPDHTESMLIPDFKEVVWA